MRLGVLDIGSNTVHLLLVDGHLGAKPDAFASHKRPLSLIQYLDDAGSITESGQDKLVSSVHEAVRFAARHGAEDMLCFCTSALREATNGPEVIARIQEETSVELTELSGAQESAMTFFAVRRWRGWSAGAMLNFDIGGGSLEIAYGHDELPHTALSVPLGAGRLTRDWLQSDPPSKAQVKDLKAFVREEMDAAYREFGRLHPRTHVSATSKTFRSLARITGAAPSADGPYVARNLSLDKLKPLTRELAEKPSAERAQLPGVSETRSRQVFAGALVAEQAMKAFGVSKVSICPWALREGLILRRLDVLSRETSVDIPHAPAVGEVTLNSELRRPAPAGVSPIAVERVRA